MTESTAIHKQRTLRIIANEGRGASNRRAWSLSLDKLGMTTGGPVVARGAR